MSQVVTSSSSRLENKLKGGICSLTLAHQPSSQSNRRCRELEADVVVVAVGELRLGKVLPLAKTRVRTAQLELGVCGAELNEHSEKYRSGLGDPNC